MEVSVLPRQLRKTDKRSEYFADSQWISNSIPLQAKTKKGTKGNKLFNSRESNNSLGVEDFLKKDAVEQVCPQKDQFLSEIFLVKK